MGEGYDECIYHKAFEVGLRLNKIDYESKSIVPVSYKGYNVGEQEIEFEVPDNFDPTAQKIAALEAKRKQINDEFLAKLFEISEKINKLQALEFTA